MDNFQQRRQSSYTSFQTLKLQILFARYGPILKDTLLVGVLDLPPERFAAFMRASFKDLAALVCCQDPEVRRPLQEVLFKCAPLLQAPRARMSWGKSQV